MNTGYRFFKGKKYSGRTKLTTLILLCGILLATQSFAADVFTDLDDYPPGATVEISGIEFLAGETVTLQITELDGTPVTGDGSLPWDVISDGTGDFGSEWLTDNTETGGLLVLASVGQTSGYTATTVFLCPGTNLDQLANGTSTTAPVWSNGNINPSNSCYSEGRSVPYRGFITGNTAGTSHYFTIEMEWTKAGIHALDFLTSYDASEDSAIWLAGGPCGDSGTAPPPGCGTPTDSMEFGDPTDSANYSGTIPADFFTIVNPGFVLDGPRYLKAYNATIDSLGAYYFGGTSSDRTFGVEVYYTADTTGSVGFFWGGHLARGNDDAWGAGNGSASISGAPAHMRMKGLDGAGGAGQDKSVQGITICIPPLASILCNADTLCADTFHIYVCRDTSDADEWLWSITNGTIIGDSTLDSVVFYVSPGVNPGETVTVQLTACNSTGGCPGDHCCANASISIPTKSCNEPPTATCPGDTTIFMCDLTQVCLDGFVCDDPDGNLANCDVSLGTKTGSTVCFTPTGAGNYTITLIATDTQGLADTCSTTVTILLNAPPVITCPADATIDCTALTDPSNTGSATATDDYSTPIITYSDVTTPGACPQEYTITRKWYAVDDCTDTSICVQTISVEDNIAPTISCPPDKTIECTGSTNPASTGTATATDNCDTSPTITYSDSVVVGSCPQEETIIRTWTATDDCGNSNACVQTINVVDTTPPQITCPADVTIECDASIDPANTGSATATDNCDATLTITYVDTTSANVIFRTWTATDDCGNNKSCTQIITLIDTTPPQITCPADVTIECDQSTDPANTGSATATDNCDPSPTISYVDNVVAGSCLQEETIIRTWKAIDADGNISTCQQTINVVDTTPPVISCPPDKTIECTVSTNPASTGTATATDNCDISVTVTYSDNIVAGSCPQEETITRTWTATDDCGNSSSCDQIINVVDTTPPTITCPADVTIECDQPTDPPNTGGSATATDNCDTAPVITYTDVVTPGSCDQEQTITRTWTATDDCGNNSSCDQIINVVDTTPPVITCPPDLTIECNESSDPSNTGSATAVDNCDPSPVITYVDARNYGIITRTWTATDDCGNSSSCDQVITIVDTTPPVITCPADATIECDASSDPSNTGSATATDNCDDTLTITYTDSVVVGTCAQESTIIRTWRAEDDNGNFIECDQTINVVDTTPPQITCPADATIECDQPIDPASTGTATATDNCDPSPVITYSDSETPGSCPQEKTITRTWTATDDCGNSSSCDQTINVVDTTPPQITCPADVTIECDQPTDPTNTGGLATATDNCDATLTITYADVVTPGSCDQEETITRTWTATDDCGNSSSCDQIIDVVDTTPPVITCPSDLTIDCDASIDPDSTGSATATDNCDPAPVITFTDTRDYGIITRTWTATDDCDNSSSCDQIITLDDFTPPEITCPPDVTMECDASIEPNVTGWATATDNCDDTLEITYSDSEVSANCPLVKIVTRTWRATDNNGLYSECDQTINIEDTSPPVITCPPNVSVVCNGSTDPDSTGYATAYDTCSENVSIDITYADVVNGDTITRTWTATDDCGNFSTCDQIITIQPNNPPVASCPGDTTMIRCALDEICIDGFSCTDPDGNLSTCVASGGVLNGTEICFTPIEGENILTLTATDSCGLIDVCTTKVTVVLNRPPTASCPSAIDTFLCALDEICLVGFVCDDPDGNLAECRVVGLGLTNGTVCFTPAEGLNTLTLIATDNCGLADTCETTVNVTLNRPPTVICPNDTTIEVYGFPYQVCISGFVCDDPDGNLISCEVNGTPLSGDTYCFDATHEGIFTLTLTATDDCDGVRSTTTCYTEVFVKFISVCPIIRIEKTHDSYQGHFEYVSITIEDGNPDIGGFDFLIAYDASALTAMEATPGQLLDDCDWEYFTYRFGANGNCGDGCPSGLLRIIAMAEMNDGPNHPSCYGPPNASVHELAEIKFLVSSDYNLNGQYVPIYFFWGDCGDNIISTISGDTAFIDSKVYDPFGVLIWDEEDDIQFPESERIPWVGAPDYCLNPIPGKPSAIRCAEFVNGGVDIIPVEVIDDRGDINLNGVANEIADATVFTNYFIYGLDAFVINVEGQKAATDINADGIALGVADLVYLMRIIVGDALPIPPKLNSGITAQFTSVNGVISVDAELGGACLLIKGNHEVALGMDAVNMSIMSRFDGINTRVLIYSFKRDHACLGEILQTDGELISAEAADYYGNGYKSSVMLPQFEVTSYPNPFNPTTTITMSLPTASDWSISIYNVVGQKVAEFDGVSEAGPVSVNWDASDYASGVYFYKAQAGIYSATKKMILLK